MKIKKRHSIRLQKYDYSTNGYYFVTVCTQNRQQIFGTIINNQMTLNGAGNMIDTVLNQIPENYAGIDLDEHTVMPNHAHAIIIIQNIVGVDPRVDPGQNNNKISVSGRTQGSAPTKLSLSSIIKCVKSLTTKKYIDGIKNHNWPPFNKCLWQRNYHDHIIRNDKSLNNIRNYIINNPATWQFDVENPQRAK